MNSVARGIERARASVNRSAGKFLPDLCNLISIGLADDGHSGSTAAETTVATNVPCRYDEATPSERKLDDGTVGYTATHKLTFGASAVTMAIEANYIVDVLPRGDKGHLFFEQPVRAKGSMAVFVTCLAKQTTGFRQPANV
jgi:hypothetical protein